MRIVRTGLLLLCLTIELCFGASKQSVGQVFSGIPADAQATILAAMGQDSWKQLAQFEHSHSAPRDEFGYSISMSGDTVVVGEPIGTDGFGAAYVFVKPQHGWKNMIQTARLTATDEQKGDQFGASVSISGDTIVVGSPCATYDGTNCGTGAAYVFVRTGHEWTNMTQTAKLLASDGQQGNEFGYAVSISGGTLGVGAPSNNHGAAYIFVRPKDGWKNATQTAELTASDGSNQDALGESISLNGNTLIAGSPFKGSYQGAAYVFVEPTEGWENGTQTAELTASDGSAQDAFGMSVSVEGKTAVVGAPKSRNYYNGAAYVYVAPPSGWTNANENAKLTGYSDRKLFAESVAISGDTVLVGQPLLPGKRGAAFLYVKPQSGWKSTSNFNTQLSAATGKYEHYFGTSVALSKDSAAVGAPNPNSRPGTAYVFGNEK